MTSRPGWTSFVSLTALALSLSVGVPEASAQGFFERLFGGGSRQARQQEFPANPPAKRLRNETKTVQKAKNRRQAASLRKAKAAPQISAPSYYTYKAEPLVAVDFSSLTHVATPIVSISHEAAATGLRFDEALAGLDEFELLAEKDIAAALSSYYAENRSFIWIDGTEPNARAFETLSVLSEAAGHGLDPADYQVGFPLSAEPVGRRRDLIRFEMALSARALRYVRDATRGRIDPNRISGYHDFPAKPLNLAGVLTILARTNAPRAYLESRHPRNPQYRALQAELKALETVQDDTVSVDPGLLLKPGQSSPELPKLLALIARDAGALGGEDRETLARLAASEVYTGDLVPVIKAAQQRAGLKPDGVVGPRTVRALVGTSKAERIGKVKVALEQLRWLPSQLGSPRVFINQPAFTAAYIDGETETLKTRVVIGAAATQTSFFYDEIEQVDYNPYWGVPQSIIVNEMLPRLRRDPGYLDRAGYEVFNGKGKRIPSSSVNWWRYGANVPYTIRQTPSEANALGELKILFPNEHAIYMHDTPVKHLFERDSRAFSHGCIRLQDPRGMAAAVLGTSVDHVAAKLKQGHSMEKTPKVPVYIAYFTAWPTPAGTVEYFDDVYDRDSRVRLAIDATEAVRAPGS